MPHIVTQWHSSRQLDGFVLYIKLPDQQERMSDHDFQCRHNYQAGKVSTAKTERNQTRASHNPGSEQLNTRRSTASSNSTESVFDFYTETYPSSSISTSKSFPNRSRAGTPYCELEDTSEIALYTINCAKPDPGSIIRSTNPNVCIKFV